VSAGDRPKILLAARPVFAGRAAAPDPARRRRAVDLNEIVTDPAYGYVAAIGGGDHNYQRYPVRLRDGRTLQYVVAGRRGRPLSATHRIPNVDRLAPAVSRTTSAATRCAATHWPGSAGTTAGCSASAASRSARRRDDDHGRADRQPRPAPSTPPADVPARARRAAGQIYPLPATGQVLPGDPPPALIEPRRPAAVPQRPADRRLRGRDRAVRASPRPAAGGPVLEDRAGPAATAAECVAWARAGTGPGRRLRLLGAPVVQLCQIAAARASRR
jgi:hypothetical protein